MKDLVYNEIVSTPGFVAECAVGTTYSLDPEIFMALSLAFAGLGEVSETDFNNPLRLLEGLRQATDRIAIFCNRGGLKPPVVKNPVYAMLDKCVFEVADNKNPLANFHPKVWLIKERSLENRNCRQLKLIVLSRNLTGDASLDIAVAMTAQLGVSPDEELRRKHEPLKRMLEELSVFAGPEKRKLIKGLVRDMETMGRFELDSQYADYDFVPLHFGKNLNPEVDFRKELPGRKMMVVSPFLDRTQSVALHGELIETPIKWLNGYSDGETKVLVTRMESLTPEIMELFSGDNREIWVMSEIAERNDIQPMNLHAKMYFSSGPSTRVGNYLWLGSANATHSGFYRNSEFILRLALKRGKRQFETFRNELLDEKKQLFQRITKLPEGAQAEAAENTLEIKVRQHLLRLNNLRAEVTECEGGYRIKITAGKIKDIPGVIKIAPLQQPFNEAELFAATKECDLHISRVADISEFYILTVTPFEGYQCEPVKMVIKIPTKGIPEDRDVRIFRSLVDTPDKFLTYVEMMVTDSPYELGAILASGASEKKVSASSERFSHRPGLYESLLRMAASNPEKLEDLQDIIRRMDSKVIPQSFLQMAEMFDKKLR